MIHLVLCFEFYSSMCYVAIMCGPEATEKLRELGCKAFIAGVTGNVLVEDVSPCPS